MWEVEGSEKRERRVGGRVRREYFGWMKSEEVLLEGTGRGGAKTRVSSGILVGGRSTQL